jgi:hypothetical protein
MSKEPETPAEERAFRQIAWLLAHFERIEGITGLEGATKPDRPPVFTEDEWDRVLAESERIMAES